MASRTLRSGSDYILNRCVPRWSDCSGCVRPCDMGRKRTIRDVAKHAPNTCICTALRHDLYSAMGNRRTSVRISVVRLQLPSPVWIWGNIVSIFVLGPVGLAVALWAVRITQPATHAELSSLATRAARGLAQRVRRRTSKHHPL
jgi:hypothetical protein